MLQLLRKSGAIRRRLPSTSTTLSRSFADDKKPAGDAAEQQEAAAAEKPAKPAAKPQLANQNRLNELLASMSTDSNLDIVKTVVAAKPKAKAERKAGGKQRPDGEVPASASGETEEIVQAARNVAAELGGNVKQTESELLAKLLNRSEGGDGGERKINDLIQGMQIDRMDGAKSSVQPKRSQFVRKSIEHAAERRGGGRDEYETRGRRSDEDGGERRQYQRRKPVLNGAAAEKAVSVNLFGEKPLGIFTDASSLRDSPDILATWGALQQRDLQLAVTHPPANHFQKMALWTEQGKLWRFPIDNEQGLDEEAQVSFTEHIFLDRHLQDWCPARGPIRHFMELVCVGLSKNPYYSVQQKVDHINWFRQYFEDKKDLLQQVIIDQTATDGAEKQAKL